MPGIDCGAFGILSKVSSFELIFRLSEECPVNICLPSNQKHRRRKRLPLTSGVTTMAGGQLKLLVIVHRGGIESGFTSDCVYYQTQNNVFITSELFTEW
jgi:hypothetical protein